MRRGFSLVLVAALVAGTVACSGREETKAPRAEAAADAAAIAEDQDALDQLRAAGSNLAKPHQIDFYLYLPSQAEAEEVGASLRPLGYSVAVRVGDENTNWICTASRTMMPTIQGLTEARAVFERLAQRHGGAYAGWQAAIER